MARKKHVFLSLPPNYSYNYNFPPLGTPCITAFLKAKGYPVTQADHNMSYYDFLLEKITAESPDCAKDEQLIKIILNSLYEKKAQSNLYYSHLLPRMQDEFLPYQDNTNSSFHFTEQLLASEALERYLEDEEENTFLQFFLQKKIVEQILDGNHDLLGLSVISPAQVIPTLTLCNLLKRSKKDFPIILGGQWPSLFRIELSKWPKLAQWINGVIFDEGETPLYEYLRALEGEQSIKEVPNLIFFEKGKAKFNRKRTEEDLNELPSPDFEGMPLKLYNSSIECFPQTAVTYQTSRECYWNRCTYCVDLPFPKHTYREKDVDLVIRDIKKLQAKYNAAELILSDLAMAPSYMRKLSNRILEENIKIRWWTFSRLDGALKPELFELANKAGCYQISYGFESANQRVCDFIDKGTKLETMSRVLKDCSNAGIKIILQTMIGLPSETMEEAMDTISFLLEHRKYLDEVCYNIYYLTPGNYVYRDPEKNLMDIDEKNRVPFQFFLKFKHTHENAMNRKLAGGLIEFYNSQLENPESQYGPESVPLLKPQAVVANSLQIGKEKARAYALKNPEGQWSFIDAFNYQILQKFNGKRTLQNIAEELSGKESAQIEKHLKELMQICRNLCKKNLVSIRKKELAEGMIEYGKSQSDIRNIAGYSCP